MSDTDERMDKMEDIQNERHLDNVQRLATIETTVKDIYRKLFGNGQPGMEQRLSDLENKMVKVFTAATVILLALEGAHIVAEYFIKR